MNPKKTGVILIVSGPSGAGKSTVCHKVMENNSLYFSVSCTTRKPREGEIDGEDYYFITEEEFENRVGNDEFIEHAKVHGNSYGTLRMELIEKISQGKDLLLDIDVQGAMQIKQKAASDSLLLNSLELIFIAPPSFEELEKRLRGRHTEPEKIIKKRLDAAQNELSYWREYDYLLINEKIEDTVEEMTSLIKSIHKKTRHIKKVPFNG